MRPLTSFAATISDCPTTESVLSTDITNAGSGGTVTFTCTSATTIPFSSPITISQDVTLDAGGTSGAITFDGGGKTQLLNVSQGASLTLLGLTLAHANSATYGGAIFAAGPLTITGSTFSGNSSGAGGAIYTTGVLTISASTFSGDTATAVGGAIAATDTLTITSSTFSGNSATSQGGAIAEGAGLTISASTFSGNSQQTGAAIENLHGTLAIGGSIIANSATGANCAASIADAGYNLSDDSTCGFSTANHDLINTNPQLGPLQNNGGPTETRALLATSPAINQIPTSDATLCPIGGTDQRGFPRPDAGESVCDIGAYESSYTWPTTTTLTASAYPAVAGQPVTFTAIVIPSAGGPPPTGTIQFRVNGMPLGSPVSLAGGQATSAATSSLLPGSSTITAVYSGDPDDLASSRSLSLQVLLPASHAGSRTTAAGTTPCTAVVTMASVNAGGSATGTFFLHDERPGGSPCGAAWSGGLTLRGTAITALVCTSATAATIYGQGAQTTAPSTAGSPVSFRADLAITGPGSPLNGTVSVQTSAGYTGTLPAVVRLTSC